MSRKAVLSKKNDYYISKHRYYELKHFCLQYNEWKMAYVSYDSVARGSFVLGYNTDVTDLVAKCVEEREYYFKNMELVEQAALATEPCFYKYILKAVTEDLPYEYFRTQMDIPCCRDVYYRLYRKFFWILDESRKKHFL